MRIYTPAMLKASSGSFSFGGMKQGDMAQRKDKAPDPRAKPMKKTDAAFDLWLQRGLHQLYDDVASEPIPEDLLRLIEDDRKK